MTVIATLDLDAVSPTGEAFAVRVQIGVPFFSEEMRAWVCALTLMPFFDSDQRVAGVDSMQALSQAIRVASRLLHDFVDDGGRLLIEGDTFPIANWMGPPL